MNASVRRLLQLALLPLFPWFWRAGAGYGDASTNDHIVYGGTFHAESGGNGARMANIMISRRPEGARFALIRAEAQVPKGHPETRLSPQ